MADRVEYPKRRLKVISCQEFRTGEGAKGKWTLYKVVCVDESGVPVDREFRAWQMLEVDKVLEYGVQKGDPPYDAQFTLHPPQKEGKLGPRVGDLEGKVANLETKIARLESLLSGSGDAEAPALSPPGDTEATW